MAYSEIYLWRLMDKGQLYEELKRLYGAKYLPLEESITYIFVNNCYELSYTMDKVLPKDICDVFEVLWPPI